MPREYNVSEEKTVHVETGFGSIEIGLLINNVPAFVTEVDDEEDIFELTAETGNDRATVVLIGDHNEDALRERYG